MIPSHFSSTENRIYFSVNRPSGTPICFSPLRKKENHIRSSLFEKPLSISLFSWIFTRDTFLASCFQSLSFSRGSISQSLRVGVLTSGIFDTWILRCTILSWTFTFGHTEYLLSALVFPGGFSCRLPFGVFSYLFASSRAASGVSPSSSKKSERSLILLWQYFAIVDMVPPRDHLFWSFRFLFISRTVSFQANQKWFSIAPMIYSFPVLPDSSAVRYHPRNSCFPMCQASRSLLFLVRVLCILWKILSRFSGAVPVHILYSSPSSSGRMYGSQRSLLV